MFQRLKERTVVLAQNKIKLVAYILICFLIVVGFTVVPLFLWMTSGIEAIGVTSIRGDSMTPTVYNNDILYVQPTKYERGEIVVVLCPSTENYSSSTGLALLKRIVGLPGETIEITSDGVLIDGVLLEEEYTDNQEMTLQENNDYEEIILSDNEYFLLGDNRATSFDSRHVGAVHSTRFLYGLTTEPNDYTYSIWRNVVIVAIINIICIVALPLLFLWLFTTKKSSSTHNQKKKGYLLSQRRSDDHMMKSERNDSGKPQPKSEKNKKREERALKAKQAQLSYPSKKKNKGKKTK